MNVRRVSKRDDESGIALYERDDTGGYQYYPDGGLMADVLLSCGRIVTGAYRPGRGNSFSSVLLDGDHLMVFEDPSVVVSVHRHPETE